MKFQYVSNAGIIFDVAGKRIGIDCLCRDSSKQYQDIPSEIRAELNLDILIFTHEHEDHFCAEYVKAAWKRNGALQIYSTKQVIDYLEKENIPANNLNTMDDGATFVMNDMRITFIKTIHEGEQYVNVQNLTLLINKEDKHLVLTGDAMPCRELFERIGTWSSQVDWLLAPFPYVGLRSTRKLIAEHLDVKDIFVLHQPRKEADVQNWIENTKRMCDSAKDGLPYPIFPEKLGEWYCIGKNI